MPALLDCKFTNYDTNSQAKAELLRAKMRNEEANNAPNETNKMNEENQMPVSSKTLAMEPVDGMHICIIQAHCV
eukprot:328980-Amphidinium_carterae.1